MITLSLVCSRIAIWSFVSHSSSLQRLSKILAVGCLAPDGDPVISTTVKNLDTHAPEMTLNSSAWSINGFCSDPTGIPWIFVVKIIYSLRGSYPGWKWWEHVGLYIYCGNQNTGSCIVLVLTDSHNLDVISITESWLSGDIQVSEILIPGWLPKTWQTWWWHSHVCFLQIYCQTNYLYHPLLELLSVTLHCGNFKFCMSFF